MDQNPIDWVKFSFFFNKNINIKIDDQWLYKVCSPFQELRFIKAVTGLKHTTRKWMNHK